MKIFSIALLLLKNVSFLILCNLCHFLCSEARSIVKFVDWVCFLRRISVGNTVLLNRLYPICC